MADLFILDLSQQFETLNPKVKYKCVSTTTITQ
jgi:hypothetical protein